MEKRFQHLTVCLDMFGCPNRCRHCWLGHAPNGHLNEQDLIWVADQFRPYASSLELFDWYREPDYSDDYRTLWELRKSLSDTVTPHFELMSVWRAVRDSAYVPWLASLGVSKVQLTLFGGESSTDFWTGRRGAYREILQAMDLLMENHISPRIQVFVNKENINELPLVEELIREKKLVSRCAAFGGEFTAFVHTGSCDGENANHYDIWPTQEYLAKIPSMLAEYTLRHFQVQNLQEVFGEPESSLYLQLQHDPSTESFVEDNPVLYVDSRFNVYPNLTAPAPYWCLGNLKERSAGEILDNYVQGRSMAQTVRREVSLGELVRACGDPNSNRLFDKGDYTMYLLNRYCEKKIQEGIAL